MRIAFYGSSLLSAYWNGAATYYRGILRALSRHGHDITFYEPNAFDRQLHRDIDPPEWCRCVVYAPDGAGVRAVLAEAAAADVVVKASGVGINDDALLAGALAFARPDALRVFWDVDAPATLAELAVGAAPALRDAIPGLDLVLTYGGGDPVVAAYCASGARRCVPVYNALDPDTHHPVGPEPRFAADLTFLGNRLPDREARVEAFFLDAAMLLPERKFLLGGSGWADKSCPANVERLGHVPTQQHNALNVSAVAVLNISRDSMASTGFSPATRVFEAAGAGACLMTDAWEGIELFLAPGEEVLVVRDARDVADALRALTPERARAVGRAALARVLAEHTYDRRAVFVDRLLTDALAEKRSGAGAA
jgi:spore maturation protein CgeB